MTKNHHLVIIINKSEQDILKKIKDEHYIDLVEYKYVPKENLSTDQFSLVEKAGLVRELIKKEPSKIRNELNHIMHVGDRQTICLNPHKYSFCSDYTMSAITHELNKLSLSVI